MTEINRLLDKLLSQVDENEIVEFKREIRLSSDIDKREFAKDVSAFGNTKGGYILYGKEDKKEGSRILGIEPEAFDADQMQQIIATRCYPPVKFSAELHEKGPRMFVLLHIPESNLKPHEIVQTREVWIRRGGITDRATQNEREKMSRERDELERGKGKLSLKEQLETEGISEEPETGLRRSLIGFGRWYMQRVYGNLDASLFKEKIVLAVSSLICFFPLAFWVYQIYSTKEVLPQWFSVLSVILAFAGATMLGILTTIESLRCPNCRRHFSIRRTEHIRVRDREIDRSDEYIMMEITYRDTLKCEFCDHQEKPKFKTTTIKVDRA